MDKEKVTISELALEKIEYIKEYSEASNASSGSRHDANANVEQKNVATLSTELFKKESKELGRQLIVNKITDLFDSKLAEEYIRQLGAHELYKHDETHPTLPYCVAVTMYPFLLNGLKDIAGNSAAPKNLMSYNGGFVNFVFAIAAQFAGAVATPEWLLYMDYFIRKDYGQEWTNRLDEQVDSSNKERKLMKILEDSFQQVVYSLNQPAAARGKRLPQSI